MSVRAQLLDECLAMAKYALASGLKVSGGQVVALEAAELQTKSVAESVDNGDHSAPLDSSVESEAPSNNADIMGSKQLAHIHAELSRLVSPAMPGTILLMAREAERKGALLWLGPVPLVRRLIAVVIICLVGLLGVGLSDQINPTNVDKGLLDMDGTQQLVNELFLLFAAGVGASFAALYRANRYIVGGTFDQKYESTYWCNIVLGLVAGMILAELIPLNTKDIMGGLGKPTLAMLGGFSAPVVYRILNRLIVAVESLVRGDTKQLIEANEQTVRLKFEKESLDERTRIATSLVRLRHLISSGAKTTDLDGEVARVLNQVVDNEDVESERPENSAKEPQVAGS